MYRDIDKGWAWIVLVASYLGVILQCTTLYMNGVLYIELLNRYHEGETKTSLVGAVSNGILCFCAPVVCVLNNRFSCRLSIVTGGIFTTVGFALSAFVPNLDWMIVTSGAIVGLGYGISMSGLVCVVGFYFEKWRDVVLSLAFLTIGVAIFLSAPLGLYLVGNYGLTTTFVILACMEAQMCVIGVVCKPSSIENEVHAQKKAERVNKVSSRSKTYIDLSLLKNMSYMCFLCSTTSWNFAFLGVIMHLPNYMSVLGGSDSEIGFLMSLFSVASIVGRLTGALTISKLHHRSIYVHVIVLAITGLLTSLFPLYSSIHGGVYVFTVQLGMITGYLNVMMAPLSLGFVGVAKLSEAYGLAYVFCGIGVTAGPILIGYIYSLTKSYEYSFLVSGCVLLLGSLSGVVTLCTMNQQSACDTNTESIIIAEEKLTKAATTHYNRDILAIEVQMTPLLTGSTKHANQNQCNH